MLNPSSSEIKSFEYLFKNFFLKACFRAGTSASHKEELMWALPIAQSLKALKRNT